MKDNGQRMVRVTVEKEIFVRDNAFSLTMPSDRTRHDNLSSGR